MCRPLLALHFTMSFSNTRTRGRPPTHVFHTESFSRTTEPVDIGVYPSGDGRRVTLDASSPPRKKRRVQPSDLDDEFAHWDPGNGGDDFGDEGDEGDSDAVDGPSAIVSYLEPLATRTRYLSSVSIFTTLCASYKLTLQDYPMLIWRQGHIQEFLQEMLRHEGLGEHRHGATCATCREAIPIPPPSTTTEHPSDAASELIRCQDCHGDCVECISCCLKRHKGLPLHRTQVSLKVVHAYKNN